MSIWEEVYSKHIKNKNAPIDPREVERAMSDSVHREAVTAGSPSLEDLYQQTGGGASGAVANGSSTTPETTSLESLYQLTGSRTQPVGTHTQETAPQPKMPLRQPQSDPQPQTPAKPSKSRFIPRLSTGKLSTSYPALLARMGSSLSDCWANILVETKQTIETLLVCGAGRKEGATFISYHLAMHLSKEYSMKVLYVDTNLNHAAIGGTQNRPGFYSFVTEKKDLAPLIMRTAYPGFYLLPSGAANIAKNTGTGVLSREPIEIVIDFCRKQFDMTIIDGQPLASSPVMIEFARAVDMTLLVCRYGFSRQEVSKLAIDKLKKHDVSSVGVILNDRKFPIPQTLYRMMG